MMHALPGVTAGRSHSTGRPSPSSSLPGCYHGSPSSVNSRSVQRATSTISSPVRSPLETISIFYQSSYHHAPVVLTVGSPTLAAFSLALTVLNTRWAFKRFSATNHPDHRRIAKALVSLQQAPLHMTTRDELLASLIVLPENEDWWERTHTWTTSAVASIAWVVTVFAFTIIDSFTNLEKNVKKNVNLTGLGVSSLWLWLIPIVVGWLWIPVCSYDKLKAAIDKANGLAFETARDSLPRTNGSPDTGTPWREYRIPHRQVIRPHKAGEFFTECAVTTAPVFNYSRALAWSLRVEEIVQLCGGTSINPRVHAHINRLRARCGFPVQGDKESIQHVPSGMWKRIFIASAFGLGLQWGTTGSAVTSIISVPATGHGCRSMLFILYGVVSTMIWMALLLSSFLAHYARMRYDGGAVSDPGFSSASVARGLATFLRRLSIFTAGCNALGIMISCMSQFSNFNRTCYCNSVQLPTPVLSAYSIIATDNFGHDWMRGGWIGGIVVTFVFLFFLHFTLDHSRPTNRR